MRDELICKRINCLNPQVRKLAVAAVGGHHIHAKAAFKEVAAYDPNKGFSISQKLMKDLKLDHNAMTQTQRRLFRELANSGRPNTLIEQTRIAKEALMAGGATEDFANDLLKASLENLKNQNVTAPSNIPWNKTKNNGSFREIRIVWERNN